jgi:superfamily II RNA helicase
MTPSLTVTEFEQQLSFKLDNFQKEAIQHLEQQHSVVVCAPTGSGKTIVAEFAALRAISEGKRLFYTTPLKALSNQKYFDLKAVYGESNVGLLTGDICINRDARIVVMTTEIFRNMLYGTREEAGLLNYLGYVVLDECHYMNDSDRGTVWEESIIYCPTSVQLIALSATIANAVELTDWINEVHHDTRLVWSDFRPVPLRFSYFEQGRLLPLFEAPAKMNRKLKLKIKGQCDPKGKRFGFRPNDLITRMAEKDMLPAIFFTFSRKECDKHLQLTHTLDLLGFQEKREANAIINQYIAQHAFLADNAALPALRNGFGSHHAGLLPAMKHLVETLFQKGLMKVVFATETLAAGINMPARSTVITKISKRTNDGHRMLTASEFLQMSGRAGRRGMDPVGYVVIVGSQYEGAREAAQLASSQADPLNSQFTPTYGMVLNLLQQYSLEQAEFLIRQSFGQFTAARRIKPIEELFAHQTEKLETLQSFQCPVEYPDSDFSAFLKTRDMYFETRRFTRILDKQLHEHGTSPDLEKQLEHENLKLKNLKDGQLSTPCYRCTLLRKHQRITDQVVRVQGKLKVIQRQLGNETDTYWRQFLSLYSLLKEAAFLSEDNRPTDNGLLTAQLRTENEYAVSVVLTTPNLLEHLTAPQLAGVLSAMLNDSNRDNQYVRAKLSFEAAETINRVETIYKQIERLQKQHRIETPLALNPVASSLVECWVKGYAWNKLIDITNIGEGDIVRHLRRVADLLRQIVRLSSLPNALMVSAREALKLLDREPIKEVGTIEPDETGESDDTGERVLFPVASADASPANNLSPEAVSKAESTKSPENTTVASTTPDNSLPRKVFVRRNPATKQKE